VMAERREAQAFVEESLAIGRELGDKERIAAALVVLGTLFKDQGDFTNARHCYEESLVLSEALDDAFRMSSALGSLAVLNGIEGKFDEAEALFERSLALSRRQGYSRNIAANLCNLATVAVRRGVCSRARTSLLEALAIAEDIGERLLGLAILGIAATIEGTEQQFERAARSYGAMRAEGERQGFDANRDDEILLPLIAQAREVLGEEAFAEAEAAGYRLAYAEAMAEVRSWMAGER